MEHDLFCERGQLVDCLDARLQQAAKEVDTVDPEQVLSQPDSVVRQVVRRYRLEAPVLRTQGRVVHEPQEVDVDVSRDPSRSIRDRTRPFYIKGTRVTVSVPFDGPPDLFDFRPSSWTLQTLRGEVSDTEVTLTYTGVKLGAERLRREIDHDVGLIEDRLNTVRSQVEEHNRRLAQRVEDAVAGRRKRLLEQRGLVEALGIPLRRRTDAPETYTLPVHRRKPAIERLPAKTTPFIPEWALPMEEYETILDIIQRMAEVIERNPSTFATIGEEQLRDHFLVQLNGQYELQGVAEAFSREGKTDILLWYESKVAFIAECKFWDGPKSLQEAIGQILRYTTWRDTKTAVLLFSRRASFSKVLEQIPGALRAHAAYKRETNVAGETRFRFVLGRPDDPNRELILTVCAFDVPKAPVSAQGGPDR